MSLFDITKLEVELSSLEKETMKENFWNDTKKSSIVLSKIKELKSKCTEYKNVKNEIINLKELTELVLLEMDETIVKEILKNTKKVEKDIEKLELQILLSRKIRQ